MPAEQLDLEVAVEGFRRFMSQMGSMDGAIDKTGGRWEGLSRIAGGVTRSMQTIGTIGIGAVVGAAGLAAGAVGGLTLALGKLAMEAAPVEGLRGAFAGLTEEMGMGSDAMMAALRGGSEGMISQRDLMESFNKAAALVGNDFAEMLPDAMGYMGKVAAATGQDFGFMLDSLVTGVGRLSPMILDNLAIQVSLEEATARAAEMFGVEEEALTKTQQQAGMMNVVLEKLEANTAALPEVAGTAAAGIAGMKARIQDTKDTIGIAFLPVLGTMLDMLGKMADEYLPIVIDAVEGLSEILSALIEYFRAVVEDGDMLNDWLTHLPESIQPIIQTIGGLITAFQLFQEGVLGRDFPWEDIFPPKVAELAYQISNAVWEIIDTAGPFIKTVTDWVKENVKLEDILIALGIAIGTVVIPIIVTLISTIAPIIAVFAGVVLAIGALRRAWETNFLGIRDKTEVVIEFVKTFIQDALVAIQAFWTEHGDDIIATVEELWETVKEGVATAIEIVKETVETVLATIKVFWDEHGDDILASIEAAWEAIKTGVELAINFVRTTIETVAARIKTFWDEHGDAIITIITTAWETIKTGVELAINFVRTTIETVAAAIQLFWSEHGDTILATITEAWENIKIVIERAITIVGNIIDAISLAIAGDWKGFGKKLREAWDTVWETIKETVTNAKDKLFETIETIIDTIKAFFTETDWEEVAKSIIDGIVTGLENGWEAITNAARALAQAALDAAKGFLGIDSPSSIFTEVGENIGQGLIAGIQSIAPEVEASITALFEGATDLLAFGKGIGGVGGAFAKRFERTQLDPLSKSIKLLNQEIEDLEKLEEAARAARAEVGPLRDELAALMATEERGEAAGGEAEIRLLDIEEVTAAGKAAVEERDKLMKEEVELVRETAAEEEIIQEQIIEGRIKLLEDEKAAIKEAAAEEKLARTWALQERIKLLGDEKAAIREAVAEEVEIIKEAAAEEKLTRKWSLEDYLRLLGEKKAAIKQAVTDELITQEEGAAQIAVFDQTIIDRKRAAQLAELAAKQAVQDRIDIIGTERTKQIELIDKEIAQARQIAQATELAERQALQDSIDLIADEAQATSQAARLAEIAAQEAIQDRIDLIGEQAQAVNETAKAAIEERIDLLAEELNVLRETAAEGGSVGGRIELLEEEIKLLEQVRDLDWIQESTLTRLETQRAEALKEEAQLQKVLLNLERQRQDLAFLEQQVKLLDIIKEYGLDAADILGGMELGINASTERLIHAMTAAMSEIIESVEEELQIGSPSMRFAEIGSQMMAGLSQSIAAQTPNIQAQIQAAVLPPNATTTSGNNFFDQRQYNLTTQSTTRPGGLAMEFAAIEMVSR